MFIHISLIYIGFHIFSLILIDLLLIFIDLRRRGCWKHSKWSVITIISKPSPFTLHPQNSSGILSNSPGTPQQFPKNSSGTPQALLKDSSATPQELLRNSSRTPQEFLKNSPGTPQELLRSFSGTPQELIRNPTGIPQELHMNSTGIPWIR